MYNRIGQSETRIRSRDLYGPFKGKLYLDGGEGGGHLDHREEGGVGGGEHVEGDHAREAHQEED